MEARDPYLIIAKIKILTADSSPLLDASAVNLIAKTVLTPQQNAARDQVRKATVDTRTDEDFRKARLQVVTILHNTPYVPPELYWLDVITPIANVVLTPVEIEAIAKVGS